MMSMATWSSISVYDFFRTYNWTGENTNLAPLNANEITNQTESLLSLNLQAFLLKSNWTGRQQERFLSPSVQLSKECLLSLSVKHFCQEIQWKKPPNIAPRSNSSSSIKLDNVSSTDLDLDNLSDLF